MLVIGERINGMFRDVRRAIQQQDEDIIQDLARRQVAAGAQALDINVGTASDEPVKTMLWLIEAVQGAVDAQLCIDSAKQEVFEPALEACNGQPIINSTTGAQDKLDFFLPLAAKHNAELIALTIDEEGVPSSTDARVEIAMRILVGAMEHGVPPDALYIDPVVLPVSAIQDQPTCVLQAISQFRQLASPSPHVVVGLSNISQRAKERALINRTMLVMTIAYGLDAAIMDPLDTEMMDAMITAELLLNKHLYCDSYLEAYRK
jgi:5-methyltetrahydrofolate corrinoid/iron sulfur protein methyltransferase